MLEQRERLGRHYIEEPVDRSLLSGSREPQIIEYFDPHTSENTLLQAVLRREYGTA